MIWILVGIIVIVGAFAGLTFLSNVTGNVITGTSANNPSIEQESFKINDNVDAVEVNDGSQNNG